MNLEQCPERWKHNFLKRNGEQVGVHFSFQSPITAPPWQRQGPAQEMRRTAVAAAAGKARLARDDELCGTSRNTLFMRFCFLLIYVVCFGRVITTLCIVIIHCSFSLFCLNQAEAGAAYGNRASTFDRAPSYPTSQCWQQKCQGRGLAEKISGLVLDFDKWTCIFQSNVVMRDLARS